MTKRADLTPRVLSDVHRVEDQLDDFDDTLQVPSRLIKTLRRFIKTEKLIPRTLQSDDKESVRQAQESLHQIQSRLDKAIHLHFSIRRRLELLLQIEIQVKHILISGGALPDTASGPRVQNAIVQHVPRLAKYQAKWNEMDKLCGMVQGHLKSAMKVIELQMKLDDNVRWSQYRS